MKKPVNHESKCNIPASLYQMVFLYDLEWRKGGLERVGDGVVAFMAQSSTLNSSYTSKDGLSDRARFPNMENP